MFLSTTSASPWPKHSRPTDISAQAAADKNFYYTDAISDHTVTFIKEHCKKDKNRPFFHYVAYTAPHWPLHALQEDMARYKGKFDDGWDELRKRRFESMRKLGIVDRNWNLSPSSTGCDWKKLPELPLPKQFEEIKVVTNDNVHAFMSMKMEI